MKLGFLGTGTIATAVITGIPKTSHHLTISRRNETRSAMLAAQYPSLIVAENQEVVDASDVVFIGCTAEAAHTMLSPLRFRADQRVVSFMAGFDAEDLKPLITPAEFDAVMIPFPAIATGGSAILTLPESALLQQLFGDVNTVLAMSSEASFHEFMAAQAVLSPAVKMVSTATEWLGDKTGDPHKAEQFLRLLVGGSILADPIDTKDAMSGLLSSLNTDGGLNQQLRMHMETAKTYETLKEGLDALSKRLTDPDKPES